MQTIKRLLILMTVVVSVAVVVFTVYMVVSSDDLAAYVTQIYQASEAAQVAVRDAEITVLRLRNETEQLISQPNQADFGLIMARISSLEALPETMTAVNEPERSEMLESAGNLTSTLREVLAAAAAGNMSEAQQLYRMQASPQFEQAERILDGTAKLQDARLSRYLENAANINRSINITSVIFASAVCAVAILVGLYANRTIRRTSAEVYQRDMIFGLISENVDAVFEVFDPRDGKLRFVSSNLERLFGVPDKDYLADNARLRGNIHPEDLPALETLYYGTETQERQEVEFRYRDPRTGKTQIFYSVLYPIEEQDGSLLHVLLTRDVTEEARIRSELETALAEAEAANRTKQEFLSRMSHEVRTPINAIIGMEALAVSALPDPERVDYYLQRINVSARHLLSLVNDILDMSKIESGRLELTPGPINMDGMLSDLVMMNSTRTEQKRQTMTVKTRHCAHRQLLGDELRLRQVLLNLLTNASKYTQEGGNITLSVSQKELSDGLVGVTFTVSDNGMGIQPEELERIFRPFERGSRASSQAGTGLGLSISRHLVECMGGRLEVESGVDQGSAFSFTVPLRIDPDAAEPETEEPGGRLLVVEDNMINMEIARELLQSAGYEVSGAANGQEAVERFSSEPPGTFAAVIMDIQMPVMDGFEAAARLRADPARLGTAPILAMTANVFSSEKEGTGLFDDFIAKPVDPKRMIAQIEAARAAGRQKLPRSSDGQSDQTIPE